ncbi:RNA-splicing factor [Thoreauomyces humboldtii]|nr:RNA-splicing factor [Thoreauomyces humboldtii]
MGGGDLNLKKSWHPGTLRNQEKVWKKERDADEEKKKLDQLLKEKNEERQLMELQALNEATGRTKKHAERLDWMYSAGPGGNKQIIDDDREAYLLGRKRVDKMVEQAKTVDEMDAANQFANANAYGMTANTVRDTQAKIREDPMLAIKKREHASLQSVLNNPVELKRLKASKSSDKKSKKVKKEKKEKKEKKAKTERRHHRHGSEATSFGESSDGERRNSVSVRGPEDRGWSGRGSSPDSRSAAHRVKEEDDPRSYGRPRPVTHNSSPPRSRDYDRYSRKRSRSRSWSRSPDRRDYRRSPQYRRYTSPKRFERDHNKRRSPEVKTEAPLTRGPPRSPPRAPPTAAKSSLDVERERRLAAMQNDAQTWDNERTARVEEDRKRDAAEDAADLAARMKRLKDPDGGQGQGFLRDLQRQTYSAAGSSAADMIVRNKATVQRGGGGFSRD